MWDQYNLGDCFSIEEPLLEKEGDRREREKDKDREREIR